MMRTFAIGIAMLLWAGSALAGEIIPGPVDAEVVKVTDGDTVAVIAHPWLGTAIETAVRVFGIDTPEKGGRAKCEAERVLAAQASQVTRDLLPPGSKIKLSGIREDKYGGRVVAAITGPDGADLASTLVSSGLARAYDGGKKEAWCPFING